MNIFNRKKPVRKREEIFDLSHSVLCAMSALPPEGEEIVRAACEILGSGVDVLCADGDKYAQDLLLMGLHESLVKRGTCYILRDAKTHHVYGAVAGNYLYDTDKGTVLRLLDRELFKDPVHVPVKRRVNQIVRAKDGYILLEMVVPNSSDVHGHVVLADLTEEFDRAVNTYARYLSYAIQYGKQK